MPTIEVPWGPDGRLELSLPEEGESFYQKL